MYEGTFIYNMCGDMLTYTPRTQQSHSVDFIIAKNTHTDAFLSPQTLPINPNQQSMFIFHSSEFTLGGSSVFNFVII